MKRRLNYIDEASSFYVVTSGRIKLFRYVNEGKVSTFEIVRPQENLAEMALFTEVYPPTGDRQNRLGSNCLSQTRTFRCFTDASRSG